jgi:hypothetical protein
MKNLGGKNPLCINFESRSESGRLKPSKKRLNITCMSGIIAFEEMELVKQPILRPSGA